MDPGKFMLFAMGGLSNAAYLFIVAAGLSLVFNVDHPQGRQDVKAGTGVRI